MAVEFIDPSQTPGFYIKPSHPGNEARGMIGFLIRRGIVNNVSQANYLLLTIALIFLAITGYIIFGFIRRASLPVQAAAVSIEKTKEMERALQGIK